MTRLARYQLYSCPACGMVYKHPLWGSISINVPHSVNLRLDRVCDKCGFQARLEGWYELGTVERFTPEEQDRRTAVLLYSLNAGPKPVPEKKTVFQRFREFWLGAPKPVDPSEHYPLIKIAKEAG